MIVPIPGHSVKVLSDLVNDRDLADDGSVGDSDVEQGTIRIRSDLPRQAWLEVLTHEILHHLFHLTALPEIVGDHEEVIIRSLAPWLVAAGFQPPVLTVE